MAKNPWQLPRGYDAATRKALSEIFASLKNARTHISPAAYEALRLGNVQAFMGLVDFNAIGGDIGKLESLLKDFAAKTGVQLYKDGEIYGELLFDIIDKRAVIWAQNHTADLVVEITEEMRQQIRDVMAESTQGLLTYEQAARKIRTNLPLTSRDSGAVDGFYNRQINKLLKSGMTLDKATEKAAARADRYAAKLLRKRSQTIARTELANAASNGRLLGWESGLAEGYIDPASVKEWVAEPDACDICGPMDGQTFPMNDEFPSGVMMPPQHPNCRCAAILLPPETSDDYFTAYAKDSTVNVSVTIEKSASDSYKPTDGMVTAAKRALRWKDEGKAKGAGTPVGWGRATDIAAGRSMSLDVVKRMFSFFSRHEVDKQGKDFKNISDPSNGRIMWDAWGGDAGFTWSKAIVEREKKKLEKHLPNKHDQFTHGKGGGVGSRPYKLEPKIVRFGRANEFEFIDPASIPANRRYCGTALSGAVIKGDTAELASGLPRELATAYVLAGNSMAEADRSGFAGSIASDPDYPRNAEMEEWISLGYLRGPAPAGFEDYIKKENAFVLEKARQVVMSDGTTVGQAMDEMADKGLAELKALASGEPLTLTMPSARAKKLLSEGRYKTVHETSSPNKNATRREYLEARERVEGRFGVPDSIADADRPVYGILGQSGFAYGDTRVFFKDEVKNRTTFTLGDSMDGQSSKVNWASDAASGNLTRSDFWDSYGQTTRLLSSLGSEGLFSFGDAPKFEPKPLRGYNKSAPVVSSLSTFGYGYVESQIHGGVKLSDIARIAFPPSYTITGPMQRQLDDAGIAVEREEITQTNNNG